MFEGLGWNSVPFDVSLLFFLSLSHALSPLGQREDRWQKRHWWSSEGEKEKVFTALGGNDGKSKANKTNFHAKFFCSFHRCRTAGAIGEAWVWQQGEFGPATKQSSWLEQRTLKTSGQILDLKLIKIRNYSSLLLLDYTRAAEAGIWSLKGTFSHFDENSDLWRLYKTRDMLQSSAESPGRTSM